MANVADVKNQVAKVEIAPLQKMIESSAKELARALPKHMNPERLVRIALTCIRQNPKLAQCTPESFIGALLVSAQLGIEPVLGRGYLLPFRNKRKIGKDWVTKDEVTFLLGYRGIAELFYRHEKGMLLEWGVYKEGDDFDYAYGTNSFLRHKPSFSKRGKTLGYYVIATLENGKKNFMYMSAEECLEHGKKHSKTWITKDWVNGTLTEVEPHFTPDSPWLKDTDSMSLKTVLIQLSKILPLSFELQQAIQADETSRDFKSGISDAFEMKPTTDWAGDTLEATTEEQLKEEIKPAQTSKHFDILQSFAKAKAKIGREQYYKILGAAGYEHANEILDKQVAEKILKEMGQ